MSIPRSTDVTAPASSCVVRRGRDRTFAARRWHRDKSPMADARRLIRTPLAAWEREGIKAALIGAGLPAGDVDDPYVLTWRFETYEDVPVGFGGLEIHDDDALLRSVVTLPPLRQIGMGAAIVDALEAEARARRCRT